MIEDSQIIAIKFAGEDMSLPATRHTTLYKYFGPPIGTDSFAESNLKDLILNNQVRLSCNTEVNDPSDSAPYIDHDFTDKDLRVYLTALIKNKNVDPGTELLRRKLRDSMKSRNDRRMFVKGRNPNLRKLITNIQQQSFVSAGFTCMTELWSNRLMWSHYAQSHKGVCIGFRTRPKGAEKVIPFAGNFLPVQYISERPVWSMKAMLRGDQQIEVTKQALLYKDDVWKYEKEWRFTAHIHEKTKPYKGGNIIEIGTDEICEVIFGMNSDDKTKEKINKMLSQSGKAPDLYQAEFKKKSFELIRNSI